MRGKVGGMDTVTHVRLDFVCKFKRRREASGMIDKRTLEKYEKDAKEAGRDSWYLSWALDTNAEERAKVLPFVSSALVFS